jgi:hypothetical protein
MSSLPPFNPTDDDLVVWLLHHQDAHRVLAAAALPGLGGCWLDAAASPEVEAVVAPAVVHREPGATPEALAGAITAWVRGGRGNAVLVAAPEVLDGTLRSLLQLPPGHGELVFLPGALSSVQLLRRRAMLRHLNQGQALRP